MQLNDTTLELKNIKLAPLSKSHFDGLMEASEDGNLWELWYTSVPDKESLGSYIEKALDEKENKKSFPFVVIDQLSEKIVGSTRYMNIDSDNLRLEIGHTWYAKSYQRTATNTICKLLLLQYAFEQLNTVAVEFRTHFHNHASRRAIERLGAKQDGILRSHRIDSNGLLRDTVVFSILNSEWPTVKKSLLHKLNNS